MAETNNSAAAAPAPATPAAESKPAVAENDAQKVFAGNLSFATTEEQLKEIFAGCGTVTNAQIITRGTRSLGYGFVTFSSEAEAQKAVSTLNKTEVGGREINVESAKPQATPSPAEAEKRDAAKAGRARGRGGRTANATARRSRVDEGEEGTTASKSAAAGTDGAEGAAKAKKTRKPKAKTTEANGDASAAPAADKAAPKPKAERAPRPPKGETPDGVPSKTLVFVANLPFDFSDEQLSAIFEGLEVTSAKVVKRPNTNKSKGFGFVDLKDEANQTQAIEKFNGKQVEGREIAIKVAIQAEKKTAAGGKEAEVAALNEASKPDATAPAAPVV